MAYVRETVQHQSQTTSSLPIKLETAYDILQKPNRLSFDIDQIDRCLVLTDRGGGGNSLCITSSLKDGSWQQRHVNDTLLTRLCIRALISRRHGGFGSPSVIFIDAGNCSDIYQCVNFARQYGLDIHKELDSIIVSRPFNVHQLAGLLIDELDPAVVTQRFDAKLVVISDLLKMFTQQQQDFRLDPDEALWLVKEIARSLRRLSSHVLLVVSMHECPAQYSRLLLLHSLFDNQIHIATSKEPGRLQVKVKSNFDNRHEWSSSKSESSSFVITERDLRIIPAR
jgi:Rad51 protein